MSDLDPGQAANLEDLAACLRQLHVLADKPTYRALEQRTIHTRGVLPGTDLKRVPLRRSTLSEVLQAQTFPRKAFLLTFVETCGVDLETDRRWEQAWNRLALQYQAQPPEVTVVQLREQLDELRRQLTAAERQTRAAEARMGQELARAQEISTARLNVIIRRAQVAESLLEWERKQLDSRFVSVCMPELDEGMTEGTVGRWFKKEGERVELDEPLLQIATPVRVTGHAFQVPGTVRAITIAEGGTAAVDTVLAVIEQDPPKDLVRVRLPDLGKWVTGGVITRWFKKEGERVELDEPLLELATDLADVEIPSPAAGIMRSIVVALDERIAVGADLGVIEKVPPEPLRLPSGLVSVSLPQLGENVTEGTVVCWLVQEGDRVEADQPLLEVSTDKVDTEIPSPAAGIVRCILVANNETVAVGTELASIDSEVLAPAAPDRAAAQGGTGRYVAPLLRKLAAEHGVDIANVVGTGVDGRIRKQDVLDAAMARRWDTK